MQAVFIHLGSSYIFEKMNEKKKESVSRDLPALYDSLRELDIPAANGSKAVYGELCYFQLCGIKQRKVAL